MIIYRSYLRKFPRPNQKGLKFELLNGHNYAQHRDQILDLQQEVYEPVRQTPMSEFDEALMSMMVSG